MNEQRLTPSGKPFDIHERLLDFACDIVRAAQFLHTRGPIARALSYQLLSAGTSTGSNAEEADGASSHDDFIAKNRIALKEAKEARFRLRVCRRSELLDALRPSDQGIRRTGPNPRKDRPQRVAQQGQSRSNPEPRTLNPEP
jgi:four helix bundle protein